MNMSFESMISGSSFFKSPGRCFLSPFLFRCFQLPNEDKMAEHVLTLAQTICTLAETCAANKKQFTTLSGRCLRLAEAIQGKDFTMVIEFEELLGFFAS